MPHRFLSDGRADAEFGQQRRVGMPETVNIGHPAEGIVFLDPGQFQVTVEDAVQAARDGKQTRAA